MISIVSILTPVAPFIFAGAGIIAPESTVCFDITIGPALISSISVQPFIEADTTVMPLIESTLTVEPFIIADSTVQPFITATNQIGCACNE